MNSINSAPPHFVIVTPSYNLDAFIEQTIQSVLNQAGDFTIHYHVQDGGSTDNTHVILEKWKRYVSDGVLPVFCRGVTFDYVIENDSGMYHAINLGFNNARKGTDSCVMAWINADDLLPPGALAAVASFIEFEQEAQFIGGRTTLMSESGFLAGIYDPQPRLRADVVAGIYHDDKYGFIQQEGIFWKSELWDKVGGLDVSLRLAGDFDLWRRMAVHAEYYCINSLTGIHRRRAGQLSGNMDAYLKEVLELLKTDLKPTSIDQKYQTHFYYELKERGWRTLDKDDAVVLQHHYLEALDHIIVYVRQHFKNVKARLATPWYFSAEGWRARSLKNQLVSTKRKLDRILRDSVEEGESILKIPKL